MMKSKVTSSDIYDINKKSGALILGKNRLDDYATKFLTNIAKRHWLHQCLFRLSKYFKIWDL